MVGEVTSDDVADCIQREWAAARVRDAAECAAGDAMDTDAAPAAGLDRKARRKLRSKRDKQRKRRR